MPSVTKKQKLLDTLKAQALQDLMLLYAFGNHKNGKTIGAQENEIIDNLLFNSLLTEKIRYSVPFKKNVKLPNNNFYANVLPFLHKNNFKSFSCLSWPNFLYLLDLIKDDEVFHSSHASTQIPLPLQLLIVLYRLGHYGHDTSFSKISHLFGIGIGSIQTVTQRVFRAILNLKSEYLHWPDADERERLVTATADELPQCIGYIDCTKVKLAEYTHQPKNQYIKLQAICDYRQRFRQLEVGSFPDNITSDDEIFANCDLAKNPTKFFSNDQWLAGDNAYNKRLQLLTPYEENDNEISLDEDEDKFNMIFSQYHIRIKICLSALKRRFKSLKELKLQMQQPNVVRYANEWINVCGILHNIVQEQNEDDLLDDCILDFDVERETQNKNKCDNKIDVKVEEKRNALMKLLSKTMS